MRSCSMVSLLLVTMSSGVARAQQSGSPKLEHVFSDDFSTDTRTDYKVTGDVLWQPGALKVPQGASVERTIDRGPWAKVELGLNHSELTPEQPVSELRVWLIFGGAPNCCVRLSRRLRGSHGSSSLALIHIGEQDGDRREFLVRAGEVPATDLEEVTIEYRYGVVSVESSGNLLFTAGIDNGNAPVIAIATEAAVASVSVRQLSVQVSPPRPRVLTTKQRRQLAEASALNRELMRLRGQGKFAEAARIGERLVDIDEAVLGEQHPHYATSLHNLATMYVEVGEYSRAEPLFKRAVAIKESVLGSRHPSYAISLNNLASLYESVGDYVRGEPLYKQARDIQRSILGKRHPDYTASLTNLGGLYESMGDYARAKSHYEEAMNIQRSVLGERHPLYATSLNNLGGLYERMGDYSRAEQLLKRALDIRKAVLGELHPDYASSLNNLAGLYTSMAEYAQAEAFYKQAIEIDKSALGEQHPDYATSLNNLAGLYELMGDYARAKTHYQQALSVQKSVLGERHPAVATSLSNLGGLYKLIGNYGRAESLFKQAIGIDESALGKQHPAYATSLGHLAHLYVFKGDYARAEPLYVQALDIWKSNLGEQHPNYASGLNNLAALYVQTGDFTRAEPLFKQALQIRKSVLGEQHTEYANSLDSLGVQFHSLGEFGRAEPLYRQAMEIRESVLGQRHPDFADSLNNLAGLYCSMREYTRAEPFYKQALEIRQSALGEGHPDYASSLNNLAALYERMGKYARAEPLFRQARDIRKSVLGTQHPDYANSLNYLAAVYRAAGDFARCDPLNSEAARIIRTALDRASCNESARQQKRHQAHKRHYLDFRLSIAQDSGAPAVEGLEAVWRWKGAVTLRQSTYRRLASNERLAPLFESLQSISRQLSVATGQMPMPPTQPDTAHTRAKYSRDRGRWEERFAALTGAREQLEARIAAASAEFRELREPLAVAAVQRLLPQGTAFVDFLDYVHASPDPQQKGKTNYQRRYIAFVVTREREPAMIGLGAAKSLGADVMAFRRALTRDRQDSMAAGRVRRRLWLPLEEHLEGIHTVIISPDTILGTVPWGALPGPEGSYLIEQYKFAAVPLAAMLRSWTTSDSERLPGARLLTIADVDYGIAKAARGDRKKSGVGPRRSPSSVTGWQSLSAANEELVEVTQLFRKRFPVGTVTQLQGTAATETQFLQQAPRYSHLHLITHGYFASPDYAVIGHGIDVPRFDPFQRARVGRDPTINLYLPGLLSGLVLAGANIPPDENTHADGVLTASEIETADLRGVELVVLSACETGLGKTAGGEGLTGLQRAFHIAGARTVVASLWNVDDSATGALMARFYRNLWNSEERMSKLDALHEAQLWLLNNSVLPDGTELRGVGGTVGEPRDRKRPAVDDGPNTPRTAPRYWAAFVLSGDWR